MNAPSRQAAPFGVSNELDDFVTFTVRRLRDAGVDHDTATRRVRTEMERAVGLLRAYDADNERELLMQLLDSATEVEASAREAMRTRREAAR